MIQNSTSKTKKQEPQPLRNKLIHHSFSTNMQSQLNRVKEISIDKKQVTVHQCLVIEGQFMEDSIHKKKALTQSMNINAKSDSLSIKNKSFKQKRESQEKQKENIERQINLVKKKRAGTAVLRQKIKQNTVLQQKHLGRKSCKFYHQERRLNRNFNNQFSNNLLIPIPCLIQNKGKQKNIIEIREQITNLFDEPIQNSTEKDQRKKKPISRGSSISFQDSVQYLEEKMPGPGQYNIGPRGESNKKYKIISTFGKQQRFKNIRPMTALQQYSVGLASSKNKDNVLEHVAFGTSKFNPRSEVKKIQYCDWNRPHFYQDVNNLQIKNLKQNPIYASTKQRFRDPENSYSGPDFYPQHSKLDKNKNGMPSYYFISQVPKGFQFPDQDQRDFYNSEGKLKMKTRIHPERKKQGKSKIQIVKQEQNDEFEDSKKQIKKRIGRIRRKKNVKKEKENISEIEGNKQEIELLEKLGIYFRKKWEISQDKWIKPSYNIKFQSKPTLFRL